MHERPLLIMSLVVAAGLATATGSSAAAEVPFRSAAAPSGGTPYGGGALGPRYLPGDHYDLAKLRLRPSRSGRTAILFTEFSSRCQGVVSAVRPVVPAQTVRIGRDGSFRARGGFGGEVGGGERQDGTFSISGRFLSRSKAVVSARARFTLTKADGTRLPCDSGTKRMTAVVPTGRGVSGDRAPGASYFGITSQPSEGVPGTRLTFSMRVSGDGRRVAQAQFEWNGRCESGAPTGGSTVNPAMPIGRTGSFAFTERYTNPEYVNEAGEAVVEEYTSQPRGRFGPRAVTGTWRIAYVVRRRSDGAVIDRCDSGPIRWRAAR